jgi:hypothetical protein
MATDRITHVVLSQGGSAGGPPWGFDPNQFRTPFLFIDPRKIEVVPNGSAPNGAVLFPVTFNPNKPKKATTIWVKAALGNARERDADSVEAMLQRALTQVQSENEAPTVSEDSSGQIQPSASVVASPGPDKNSVKRKVLSTS